MNKNLKRLAKYTLELLIVAFGVILGLFVSNWNSKKATQANIDKTISHLRAELESNVERLASAYVYHESLCTNIDSVVGGLPEEEFLKPIFESSFKHFKIPGWKGIGIAGLEDIVFESAKVNGVFQEIDIEMIQNISRAYKVQDSYSKLSRAPLDKFLTLDSNAKVLDVVGILELLCSDIKNHEVHASEKLNEILEKIK